jgi:hypothetical protein
VFRLAQLALLMSVATNFHSEGVHRERLGAYDFMAANPLLVATTDDDPDRLTLLMAGFNDHALSYASAAQRFATRRERLQQDLALLVSYGLVDVAAARGQIVYQLTDLGHRIAQSFTAMYARAYRTAAVIVIERLRRLSDTRLQRQLAVWTQTSPSRRGPIDLADLFIQPLDEGFEDDTHDAPPPEAAI